MTNLIELIRNISSKIKESSDQKAWWIIEAITKKNKSQLMAEKNFKLSSKESSLLDSWLDKYINQHMPLQYLIGNVPFLDLEILVEKPILIPRPETEYWCWQLIEKLNLIENKKITILDLATGTGCIALSLAKSFKEAQVYATDISDQALNLAKKNIVHNKINNVQLIKSDLFENLENIKFDLIVSNPPYIDQYLYEKLDPSVKNWEDPKALVCSDNGLFLIKKIISQSKNYLKINEEFAEKNIPQLVIEIDYTQGQEVIKYLNKNDFSNIKLYKDLFLKDRVVSARR
jgi:release factor glutamine methyltransferase